MGIDKLKDFLVSLVFSNGIPVAKILLKDNWEIPQNHAFEIQTDETIKNCYYIVSNTTNHSTDFLLLYLENIIEYNVDLEKRLEWYNAKVNELKKIIKHNPSSELNKFKIVHNDLENYDTKVTRTQSSFSQIVNDFEDNSNNIEPISVLENIDPIDDFAPQYPPTFVMEKEEDFDEDSILESNKPTFRYNPNTGEME